MITIKGNGKFTIDSFVDCDSDESFENVVDVITDVFSCRCGIELVGNDEKFTIEIFVNWIIDVFSCRCDVEFVENDEKFTIEIFVN